MTAAQDKPDVKLATDTPTTSPLCTAFVIAAEIEDFTQLSNQC